jgi:threonine/homoserine/homoserine lactone efflux protein
MRRSSPQPEADRVDAFLERIVVALLAAFVALHFLGLAALFSDPDSLLMTNIMAILIGSHALTLAIGGVFLFISARDDERAMRRRGPSPQSHGRGVHSANDSSRPPKNVRSPAL